jgi:hypothetical protein
MPQQLQIACLMVSSQNAFHFILSLSDSFCKSWRWYGLKRTLRFNTFHTVGSGIWSSLLACTADFHGLLMNASQMWSTVSTLTSGQPVLSTLADKPFIYKLPIPTSRLFWLWAIHCQTLFWSINELFIDLVSWNHMQYCGFCSCDTIFIWQLSEHHPWLICYNQCCQHKCMNFLAAFKQFHVCICNHFTNTLISFDPNHL